MSAPLIDIDSKYEEVKRFFRQFNDPEAISFVEDLESITTPYKKLHVIFQATFFIEGFKLNDTVPARDFVNDYLQLYGLNVQGHLLEWTAKRYNHLDMYTQNYNFHTRA